MAPKNKLGAAERKLKTMTLSPKIDLNVFRNKINERFGTVFLPNQVECVEQNLGGISCDFLTPEIYVSHRVILYVHGCSFVGGSKFAYRSFCASLANASSCRAVVPDFRLAPAFPFPASVEDAFAAFEALFAQEKQARSSDAEQTQIILAADGSGASIAIALILQASEELKSAVNRLVLLSPWLDVSPASKTFSSKKKSDRVMSVDCLKRAAELYTYMDNRNNPLVSPLKADFAELSRLSRFPPVYIQAGSEEILLDDAKRFQSVLNENGCKCVVDVWQGMMHLFQFADEYIEEAHVAVEKLGKIIRFGTEDSADIKASEKVKSLPGELLESDLKNKFGL